MDTISITALVIAIIGATSSAITQIHLNKCSCFCVNSDCHLNDEEKIVKREREIEQLKAKSLSKLEPSPSPSTSSTLTVIQPLLSVSKV